MAVQKKDHGFGDRQGQRLETVARDERGPSGGEGGEHEAEEGGGGP